MEGSEVRDQIILKTVQEELLGPCIYGESFDWQSGAVKKSQLNTPLKASIDHEEILKVYPIQRYGIGVIYPIESSVELEGNSNDEQEDVLSDSEEESIESPSLSKQVRINSSEDSNDFDISLANTRSPSSMGISFLIDLDSAKLLEFNVSGAFYKAFTVTSDEGHSFNWWKREPINFSFSVDTNFNNNCFKIPLNEYSNDPRFSYFYIEGICRKYHGQPIITAALVNRTKIGQSGSSSYKEKNQMSLFQSELKIRTLNSVKEQVGAILPYPSQPSNSYDDLSNELLYLSAPTFGKGHGVAVDWSLPPYVKAKNITEIYTKALPTFETPSITADIESEGEQLKISMEALTNFEVGSHGEQQLNTLILWYRKWIKAQKVSASTLKHNDHDMETKLKEQALIHIGKCELALTRIDEGLQLIKSDDKVRKAFKLANKAMLVQQRRAPKEVRTATIKDKQIFFPKSFTENPNAKGIWRPFQIGFLLMCISGAVDLEHDEHELVDLIWFPTGGGKTEAYLGLAAFTILYSRLIYGNRSEGVQVLMRYTLRLLTAQQLQRAATLICCLEVIRRENNIQGKEFSIGLWVGSKNTPNKRAHALTKLNQLKKNIISKGQIDNPFLLDRCPYCGAQMGIASKEKPFVIGYKKDLIKKTVFFSCADKVCSFNKGIPVYIIDEDIYDVKPSIVIGTVDKFALLAWEPKIRNLFGINSSGERDLLPPQLIIQDELHLITGPLGTMVGHYEPLVEELCSFKADSGKIIRPKIICATATTKGFNEQIEQIYGRSRTEIFPPPGLNAEDSFFSKYERYSEGEKKGELTPGRKYVGICAPGLGSILTTQVRTHSAMLFASNRVEIEKRDPWLTLLSFYNSIRELGGALTLFQADINSYLLALKQRYPKFLLPRFLNGGMELTSRLKDDEIPAAITLLERGLKYQQFDSSFYKYFVDELESLKTIEPELEPYIIPLLSAINKSGRLKIEDYIFLGNLKVKLKEKNIEHPQHYSSLLKILQARDVTPFCLASSIIEVGVDIDRLSLMSIVGQPKTTAQYIQVSGRVGRRPSERPGLVTIIYNNAKPRDKSHYEEFRSYHQKLYAQVEPSSVTPYSQPAIERGLSAQMVGYARQFTPIGAIPSDIDISLFERWFERMLEIRKTSVKDSERNDLKNYFEKKFLKWWKIKGSKSTSWGHLKPDTDPEDSDVMCPLGATGRKRYQFECPTSMRNVDGDAVVWISPQAYEPIDEDDFEW
ncbi:helicase-related protein [Moritella viscosa]|uniref:Helicase domain protein n=2 Tax=Moritella viscosa TaxID=80854 RepID=A0A1L0AR64_9GAMM|nr:helicase-related protein [Moritella viscosa]SGZ19493.1 Helicase domain protein [Moritella viscosa]